MELSLEQRIINYLQAIREKYPDMFVNGGEIERLALAKGYKASNASRRLRELTNEGVLERQEDEKGHVEYRSVW